jgi:ribose transport system permease protein
MGFLNKLKIRPSVTELSSSVLLLVIIVINVILQPGFFSLRVFNSNMATFSPLILISIAQAIIIICGGLDLSVGSAISLINCVLGIMMKGRVGNDVLALVLAFAVAMAMGLVNGFLVGYLKMPSMIATFATAAIWSGSALLIMPRPGGYISDWATNLFNFQIAIFSAPLIMIIVAMLIWLFIKRGKIGKFIYAVGSDEEAAYANGIKTRQIKIMSYVIGYVFIFLAALAISFQTSSSDPTLGAAYTLTSIATVVIGGISLKGGQGHVIGAVIGALIMELIVNVIYFANIPSTFQQFMSGLIVILVLSSAVIYKRTESINSNKL